MKNQLLLLVAAILLSSFVLNSGEPKIKLPKAYVYVPSGQYTLNGETKSIQGFYIQSTEVSNLDYKEFLFDLKYQGRTEDLAKAQVHSEGWKQAMASAGPFVENYFDHKAYENYPVVNISHEAAEMYCEWLSTKLAVRYPDYYYKVRLPEEIEWCYAASAGQAGRAYPNGPYLHNSKGQLQYNYRHLGDEAIHRDKASGAITVKEGVMAAAADGTFFSPSPTISYEPNDFGLFNTSGNVAEMLREPGHTKGGCFNSTGYDIRIDAPDEFAGQAGPSPYIGFRPVISVVPK